MQAADIPTYAQFYYFYNTRYRNQNNSKEILTNQKTLKDHKPLTSTATKQANGPGARYEIDSTIADIYLVSSRDPSQIIGRPTVYIVIDVFSRMITGLYVGMENSSFNTAIQCLSVAIQDKVTFCQSYGLQIQPEDWPIYGLPGAILADRGELIGYQIELLEKTFLFVLKMRHRIEAMLKVLWRGLLESFSHALNPTRILVLFLDSRKKERRT